jgi:predicted amidohydrolase YtcJ
MKTMVIIANVWNPSRGGGEPAQPRAVWIENGRVADVTPVESAPKAGARPDVEVMSYPRGFVMPAFVDAHFHLLSLAHKALRCDLSTTQSASDVGERLADYARHNGGSATLVGVDFDESDWRDKTLPTRAQLDSITRDRPLYARRVCCHVGVANTALLDRLESPHRFIDRESGRIVEDAVFEANRLTKPPAQQQIEAVDGALAHLHSLGITAIHDIVDPGTLEVYVEGLRRSQRPLRIDTFFHVPAQEFAAASAPLAALRERGVRALGIKIFSDGSLGGRTAALNHNYADGDGNGELLVEPRALQAELEECARQNIACAVHAIGDRALRTVLDAMSAAKKATTQNARFRIEHAEIIGEEELQRCKELRIPLVMQPNFVRNWGGEDGMYEARLGHERWLTHNPFASLTRADVPFVFSSDGMPAGPLFGLRGATLHANATERIGPGDAFYRYTCAAADVFAGWEEDAAAGPATPAVKPGARADLVVLSAHPLLTDVDRVRVEATLADGAAVYVAPPLARPITHSKLRR